MASIDTNLFTGPLFVGNSLAWASFGVSTVQVYHWYSNYPSDSLWLKLLVWSLYILGNFHTVTVTHFSWFALVEKWGNPEAFASIPWSGWMHPILTGIISLEVQLFLCYRIWKMRVRHKWAPYVAVFIAMVAGVGSGGGLSQGIRFALINDISKIPTLTAGSNVWLGGSFACDILIALTMLWILEVARRNTPVRQTEALIARLMINTVETGLVTAVAAGVDMVLFIRQPNNYMHLCPSFVLPKLYCIVAMVALNNRGTSASKSTSQALSIGTANNNESHQLGNWGPPARRTLDTGIRVNTQIESSADDDFKNGRDVKRGFAV